MSLTKQTVIDQITVTENGIILYREVTRIMEDGNEISKTYHRSSLVPAQDLTGSYLLMSLQSAIQSGLLKLLRLIKRHRLRLKLHEHKRKISWP